MLKKCTALVLLFLFSHSVYSKVEVFFNQYQLDSYTDSYRNKTRRGQDLEEVILSAINSAKSSIYIAVQELRLPKIAKALVARKSEGLDVRLILEEHYNNNILSLRSPKSDDDEEHESSRFHEFFAFVDTNRSGKLSVQELKDRDAIYILQHSDVPIKDDSDNVDGSITGLMHHKFVIIDSKTVLLSSANFTMSGVHGDILAQNSTGNANALVKVNSEDLARVFTREFMYMWGGVNSDEHSRFKLNKPFRGREVVKVEQSKFTVQFSPTSKLYGKMATVNGLIADTISSANKSINMALFVFSDQMIADYVQVRKSKNDDLELGLLIEPRFAYRNYSEMLDFWGIQLLDEFCEYEADNNPFKKPVMSAGVPTLNGGDMLHHKFAVVDNKKVIFGSQNWSEAANHSNDEFLVVIEDEEVARKFSQEFNRLNSNARLGVPRSLIEKIEQRHQECF